MIAVISDLHSNLEALEAVLKDIQSKKISKIFCCGDIVGYNTNPNEVCELLEKKQVTCILGNHDQAILSKDYSWFNSVAEVALQWTQENISKKSTSFLKSLSTFHEEIIENKKHFFVHGSPEDHLYQYVFPGVSDKILEKFLKSTKADVLVMGHTHFPFTRKLGNKLVVNPGSVGQPRDNNPKASYAIMDGLEASIRRVPYDFITTQKKLKNADLPYYLSARLAEGI